MACCRLCLVGSCPGGTASNVVTYLARADVTLSVLMTTASTLGAVVATPLLSKLLLGTLVAVDAMGLLMSTLQVRCMQPESENVSNLLYLLLLPCRFVQRLSLKRSISHLLCRWCCCQCWLVRP